MAMAAVARNFKKNAPFGFNVSPRSLKNSIRLSIK
jgi:hypothetical protein